MAVRQLRPLRGLELRRRRAPDHLDHRVGQPRGVERPAALRRQHLLPGAPIAALQRAPAGREPGDAALGRRRRVAGAGLQRHLVAGLLPERRGDIRLAAPLRHRRGAGIRRQPGVRVLVLRDAARARASPSDLALAAAALGAAPGALVRRAGRLAGGSLAGRGADGAADLLVRGGDGGVGQRDRAGDADRRDAGRGRRRRLAPPRGAPGGGNRDCRRRRLPACQAVRRPSRQPGRGGGLFGRPRGVSRAAREHDRRAMVARPRGREAAIDLRRDDAFRRVDRDRPGASSGWWRCVTDRRVPRLAWVFPGACRGGVPAVARDRRRRCWAGRRWRHSAGWRACRASRACGRQAASRSSACWDSRA